MNYRNCRNYENLERRLFDGVGEYGIPQIEPVAYEGGCDWIGFNYAKSTKDCEGKGVHFFLDDYQFCRLWSNIDRYIPMLQRFRYVMSPDFSTYTDFPKACRYTTTTANTGVRRICRRQEYKLSQPSHGVHRILNFNTSHVSINPTLLSAFPFLLYLKFLENTSFFKFFPSVSQT